MAVLRKSGLLVLFVGLLLGSGVLAQDTSQQGAVTDLQYRDSFTAKQIDEAMAEFYPVGGSLPARLPVDAYRLELTTEDPEGNPVPIVAQLYVPRVLEAGQAPLFVFAPGTTGLADECAPSLETQAGVNWGQYQEFLLSYATQGFIAVAPDYPGFNDPDAIQPYYVGEMAGRGLLDTSRAIYNLFETQPDFVVDGNLVSPADFVFIAGYSQGGQAIFAAKDMAADYAPELPIAGILGYGSVTNMRDHMLVRPQFAPYRMVAYRDYYGEDAVDYSAIFQDMWVPTLEADATSKCVADAFFYYPADPVALFKPDFYAALVNDTVAENFGRVGELLELNSTGHVPNDIPALILQAGTDNSVSPEVQTEWAQTYCAIGNRLTWSFFPEANHLTTRQVSFNESLGWMRSIVSGEEPPQDCDQFTS